MRILNFPLTQYIQSKPHMVPTIQIVAMLYLHFFGRYRSFPKKI